MTPAPLGSSHFTLTGTTTGWRSLRRFFPFTTGSSNTNFLVVTSYLQSCVQCRRLPARLESAPSAL